jgi:hypothetical protein
VKVFFFADMAPDLDGGEGASDNARSTPTNPQNRADAAAGAKKNRVLTCNFPVLRRNFGFFWKKVRRSRDPTILAEMPFEPFRISINKMGNVSHYYRINVNCYYLLAPQLVNTSNFLIQLLQQLYKCLHCTFYILQNKDIKLSQQWRVSRRTARFLLRFEATG